MKTKLVREVTVWDTLMTTDGRRAKVKMTGNAKGELYRGQRIIVWFVENGTGAHVNNIDFLAPDARVEVAP